MSDIVALRELGLPVNENNLTQFNACMNLKETFSNSLAQLEQQIMSVVNELSEDTKELIFDMSGVEYISSAGIRVLLGAYKKMNSHQGKMRIEKANDMVREVFEMTGLSDMLE